MPDTILEGNHPRIISAKFSWDWLCSFRRDDILNISFPLFSIFSLAAILVESRDHRTHFGRGPCKDHSTKIWLQLVQWFLRRRFLCEFPIGSYVKLSSTVGAILVEGPNRRTHFWKRTIQWLFHQNLVLIEQMVSDKKIFMGISHRVLCLIKFGSGGHLGRRSEMPDTILEGDHPRIISAKFGWDWLSSFSGEDFF
jgi:hypothetical protein